MEIRGKGLNPSKKETKNYAKWLALECYKEPSYATDIAIDSVIAALGMDGYNSDVVTTLTIPLDEYRLLISDAQKKAKEEGRKEAWDLARRIVTCESDAYTRSDFDSAFGSHNANTIFGMPADDALALDKKYQEDKKTLHVGDEVEFGVGSIDSKKYRGYITDFVNPNTVRVLTKKLGTVRVKCKECEKTGRHSDEIEKVMASFEKGEC